jgi:hypothetical protein
LTARGKIERSCGANRELLILVALVLAGDVTMALADIEIRKTKPVEKSVRGSASGLSQRIAP